MIKLKKTNPLKMIKQRILQSIVKLHPLTYGFDPRVNPLSITSRSFISKEGKYCYFRIPKCANSTICKTLGHYDASIELSETDYKGKEVKAKYSNLFASKVLTKKALARKYYLFTFVRNPYSRVLSAYLDKIKKEKNRNKYANVICRIKSINQKEDLTFGAFIKYLECGGLYENTHWTPQTSLIPVSVSQLDFIGKVESLDNDLSKVLKILFGSQKFEGVISRSEGQTSSGNKLYNYYTPELAERVNTLYEVDFSLLGYPNKIQD